MSLGVAPGSFLYRFVGLGLRLGLFAFESRSTSAFCFEGEDERNIVEGEYDDVIRFVPSTIDKGTGDEIVFAPLVDEDGTFPYRRLFRPVFAAEEEEEEEEDDNAEDMNPPSRPNPLFDLWSCAWCRVGERSACIRLGDQDAKPLLEGRPGEALDK